MKKSRVRAIAIYLPQYHPIPENDQWWGTGFTEWQMVAKAQPLYPGHTQPQLPADLGFYDLRLAEVRRKQADLAREHGIQGFCYYHYWFNGKRLLERPFDEVLASGEPDFPFCLCWANESWTRRWDGHDKEVLLKQTYSADDDKKHIHWLMNAFRDKRYIRVDDKPLILIYRPGDLPDPLATASVWRQECRAAGLGEIFLCAMESIPTTYEGPKEMGFDASVEFQPDWVNLGIPQRRGFLWSLSRALGLSSKTYQEHDVYDYASVMERTLRKEEPRYHHRIPCVMPAWDNSPRRAKRATIISGSTPRLYEKWLAHAVKKVEGGQTPGKLLFINAWNEWGEGNHLEPDTRFGLAYLEATKQALSGKSADKTAHGGKRKRNAAAAPRTEAGGSAPFIELLPRLNKTVAPQDALYPVFEKIQPGLYFESGLRQLETLDQLLRQHTGKNLVEVQSVADFACHYGRLLRCLRAAVPKADLYACDIDQNAVDFCVKEFGCKPFLTGWQLETIIPPAQHEMVTCLSLLTHVHRDFVGRVLPLWERMLGPGGLLLATFMGESYIDQWLEGKLEALGAIEPAIREQKALEFRSRGHVFCGYKTGYSETDEYGIAFIHEDAVAAEISKHPNLRLEEVIPGQSNACGQDLAVIRKISD